MTNNPVAYAKVCLNKNNDIYQVDYTNGSGQVAFIITPQTAGMMKITVTRSHNLSTEYIQYLPSRTTCQVGWPGGEQASSSEDIFPDCLSITGLTTITKGVFALKYCVPKKGDLTISIYNTIGSKVLQINQECLVPGYYDQKIDMETNSNGIYFIVLTNATEKASRKFILTK